MEYGSYFSKVGMNLYKLMSTVPLNGTQSLGILKIDYRSSIISASGNSCGPTGIKQYAWLQVFNHFKII